MHRILLAGLPDDLALSLEGRLAGTSFQTTYSAEETLVLLRTGGWSLLVIDHSLAGGLAPQVVSQVRERLGLTQLPVIYFLDKNMGGSLSGCLVDRLGVHQLLFHPIDEEELSHQIASTLGMVLAPVSASARRTQDTTSAIAKVWKKYRGAIIDRLGVLERASAMLSGGELEPGFREIAVREAHKLAGSVGTFGFPKGSRLAREAEQILLSAGRSEPGQGLRLAELVACLRTELGGEPSGFKSQRPAVDRTKPLLLIVDDDLELAGKLALAATERGLRAETAISVAAARDVTAGELPAAVVLDPSFTERADSGLGLLAEFSALNPPVPVIVFTDKDTFTDRVEIARLGGRGFLQKPMPIQSVLDMVFQALSRARASEPKVMAIDDDPQVLSSLQEILGERKMRVTTLDNPLKFWQVLEEASPDVLILDVDMPHLSGIELCRVVRNDPRWLSLPVVFLTAHTDPHTVRRVYAAGADDFIAKPMVGEELVARIVNCVERVRLLRSITETDSLTQTMNRRKSMEVLDHYLRFSRRLDQPFCMAALNVDHFREVTSRYGHAAGDKVLRRLGAFLLQAFRSEDVVARWSGEEFVVGMYGMPRADGTHRLAEVLETLRQEIFTAPDGGRFRVSFSAGVAQYPDDGANLDALYWAAEEALRRAQESGRDRVMPAGRRVDQSETDESPDILLVDNEESLAAILVRALETRGYRTRWLQNGQAAVNSLAGSVPNATPRVVLLNKHLPDIEGQDVLKRLAENGVLERTRVIMLDPESANGEAKQALETGAFGHVAKPLDVPELMQHVRRAMVMVN